VEYTYNLQKLCESITTKQQLVFLIEHALYSKYTCRENGTQAIQLLYLDQYNESHNNILKRGVRAIKSSRYHTVRDLARSYLIQDIGYSPTACFIYQIVRAVYHEARQIELEIIYRNMGRTWTKRSFSPEINCPICRARHIGSTSGTHTLEIITDTYLPFVQRTELEIITD